MKKLFVLGSVAATLALAEGFPKTDLRGDYIEARTADVYTGPCFANGEANQAGDLAVFGWTIQKGAWQGVNLDGLSVVGAIKASGTLGNGSVYPVRSVLIIDRRANAQQRLALKSFAQRMGGDLLQNIVRVEYLPIRFQLRDNNIHTATATLDAGRQVELKTRKLEGSDDICHNEVTFYPPLTKVDHAMPAFALANRFDGQGLGTIWSNPYKRSAFVATFHYQE